MPISKAGLMPSPPARVQGCENGFCRTIKNVSAVAAICLVWSPANAAQFQVKELDRGPAGFFVFEPELVRINPGDSIEFVATDKGHDVQSVSGMIPDGAQPFEGKTTRTRR